MTILKPNPFLCSLLTFVILFSSASAYWWNAGWQSKSVVSVTETAGLARNNETISIDMSSIPGFSRSHVKNGCDDLRVIDYASHAEKAFTNTTCDSTSVVLSFSCNAAASASTYPCAEVYWYNPSASAPTTPSSLRLTNVDGGAGTAGTYVEYGYMESKVVDVSGIDGEVPTGPMFGNATGMSFYQAHMNPMWAGLAVINSGALAPFYYITYSNRTLRGIDQVRVRSKALGGNVANVTRDLAYYDTGKAFLNVTMAGDTSADYRAALIVPRSLASGGVVDYRFEKYGSAFDYATFSSVLYPTTPTYSGLNYFGVHNTTTKEYLAFVLAGNNTAVKMRVECYNPTTYPANPWEICYLSAYSDIVLSNPSWQFWVLHGRADGASDLQTKLDNEYTKAVRPLILTAGDAESSTTTTPTTSPTATPTTTATAATTATATPTTNATSTPTATPTNHTVTPTSTIVPTQTPISTPTAGITHTPSPTVTATPNITQTPTATITPTGTQCPQVITPAVNPEGKNCREFKSPCDVPRNWIVVDSCLAANKTQTGQQCDNGCPYGDSCIPFGTRFTANGAAQYCDFAAKSVTGQKNDRASCQNSYECTSNYCASGTCTNVQKDIQGIMSLLEKIMDILRRLLGAFSQK